MAKEMEPISVRKILGVALVMMLFMIAIFVAWFYVFIVPVEQAAALKRAKADAIDRELRAKYCISGYYENEIIRRFCTTKK